MKSQLGNLLILVWGLISYGCVAVMIGAGAGAGAAAYIKGKVTQVYDSDYPDTVQASIEALKTLKLPVSEKTADKSKTLIRAEHADGTPVTVEVVPAGPGQTEVGVRTGALGISTGEMETSEQIQAGIKKQLAKFAMEESKAAERPAALAQPEPVEEPPRDMAVSKTSLERDKPTSIQAGGKNAAPEFIIYFNRDSNELLQSEIAKLNQIVEAFTRKPGLKLILNGYSDSSGSMEYNRMISESRASTVKLYLAGKGWTLRAFLLSAAAL
jgi:outer membrane protein OmpA-like peptidoglycan-associated protein